MALILAALGALLVAVGAGMIFLPAGVVVAGSFLIAAAYIRRYLEAAGENVHRVPRGS